MEYNEDTRLHLKFIQDIITRLGNNSFHTKGCAITIVSTFLALYASTSNEIFLYITFLPSITFWIVDAKYLQIERHFRKLYSDIIDEKGEPIPVYSMKRNNYKSDKSNIFHALLWSWSITLLYGVMIVVLIILILLDYFNILMWLI